MGARGKPSGRIEGTPATLAPLRRAGALLWGPLAVLFAVPAWAATDNTDIARLTLGRPVFPADSWVAELTPVYSMWNLRDPTGDTLATALSVEHAFTERFQVELALQDADGPRTNFSLDAVRIEARYLVLEAPLFIAPYLSTEIPLNGESFGLALGIEALKNVDSFTFQAVVEFEAGISRTGVGYEGDYLIGAYYRFGLNGLVGGSFEYDNDTGPTVQAIIGGRVSPNIFLALAPTLGLARSVPQFQIVLQLTLYLGPFRVSGLD
jgi:hypothetical protein